MFSFNSLILFYIYLQIWLIPINSMFRTVPTNMDIQPLIEEEESGSGKKHYCLSKCNLQPQERAQRHKGFLVVDGVSGGAGVPPQVLLFQLRWLWTWRSRRRLLAWPGCCIWLNQSFNRCWRCRWTLPSLCGPGGWWTTLCCCHGISHLTPQASPLSSTVWTQRCRHHRRAWQTDLLLGQHLERTNWAWTLKMDTEHKNIPFFKMAGITLRQHEFIVE